LHQSFYLARFYVPPGAKLGVEQLVIDGHFKRPARRGDERDRFDAGLERLEQFCRQTDGARGVVSNSAIFDGDDHVFCSFGSIA